MRFVISWPRHTVADYAKLSHFIFSTLFKMFLRSVKKSCITIKIFSILRSFFPQEIKLNLLQRDLAYGAVKANWYWLMIRSLFSFWLYCGTIFYVRIILLVEGNATSNMSTLRENNIMLVLHIDLIFLWMSFVKWWWMNWFILA